MEQGKDIQEVDINQRVIVHEVKKTFQISLTALSV